MRIISASNKNPKECVEEGRLRLDIYYRLCVLVMKIPPLRERKEDIPLLFKNVKSISREVYEFLNEYSFPGNVRELEHIVEYAMNVIDKSEDI